jgi:hypothetical protein
LVRDSAAAAYSHAKTGSGGPYGLASSDTTPAQRIKHERHAGQVSPELIQALSGRAATQATSRQCRAIRHNTLICAVSGPAQLDHRGRTERISRGSRS